MKRFVAVIVAIFWLAGVGTAFATLPMQKQARDAGLQGLTCLTCHGEKVPRKGAMTLNEKGKWLVGEKDKRKAKEVDGAWLKDYKEKK